MLSEVATERLGLQVVLSEDRFKRALDPRAFVEARDLPGGAAPKATAKVLDVQRERIEDDRQWLAAARDSLTAAEQELHDTVSVLISS